MRTIMMRTACALACAALAAGGCGSRDDGHGPGNGEHADGAHAKPETPGLVHSVFFWLKDGVDRTAFVDGLLSLKQLDVVKDLYVGVPETTENSKVEDVSWTYSLIVHFDGPEGLAAYKPNPIHQKFVNTFKPYFKTVKVYDSLPAPHGQDGDKQDEHHRAPSMVKTAAPGLIHHVYFWTEPDTDQAGMVKALRALAKIESVKAVYVGVPMPKKAEPAGDNPFQVSLIVHFDSQEGLNAYLPHSVHQALLDKYKKKWKSVVVYDSVPEK